MVSETRSHISLLPSSRLGWSAMAAMALSIAALGLVLAMMSIDSRPTWLLAFHPTLSAGGGIAALALALVAIARRHERSILMLPPLAWGSLVVVVIVAELAFPH